jgi:signal recognition particle subunit SRP54
MAGRILGMGDVVGLVETAQKNISEQEAQSAYEKMVLGDFTLEDMLGQLRMIKRMGPLKKVLGMLPGMSQLGDLDALVDDKRFSRMEALFTSMTPRERIQPDLLDMNRRRRIARGAGQDLPAVNELLKRFKEMKLVMKQMQKLGLGAKLGAKEKRASLAGMSSSGELSEAAGDFRASGGGLPSMSGGAGSMGGMGGAGGLAGLFGGSRPPRPMGSSATRQSGSKRKDKKKRKKRR